MLKYLFISIVVHILENYLYNVFKTWQMEFNLIINNCRVKELSFNKVNIVNCAVGYVMYVNFLS